MQCNSEEHLSCDSLHVICSALLKIKSQLLAVSKNVNIGKMGSVKTQHVRVQVYVGSLRSGLIIYWKKQQKQTQACPSGGEQKHQCLIWFAGPEAAASRGWGSEILLFAGSSARENSLTETHRKWMASGRKSNHPSIRPSARPPQIYIYIYRDDLQNVQVQLNKVTFEWITLYWCGISVVMDSHKKTLWSLIQKARKLKLKTDCFCSEPDCESRSVFRPRNTTADYQGLH